MYSFKWIIIKSKKIDNGCSLISGVPHIICNYCKFPVCSDPCSKLKMLASEKQTGLTSNEQFVLLAKSAKGPAVVELIKQVLAAPGVYVFGELLAMPTVQEVGSFYTVCMPVQCIDKGF